MNLKILVPISLIGLAVSCSSRRDGAQAPEAVIPVKVGNVRRIHTTQTVPVGGCVLSWKNASNGAFVVSGKVVEEGIHSARFGYQFRSMSLQLGQAVPDSPAGVDRGHRTPVSPQGSERQATPRQTTAFWPKAPMWLSADRLPPKYALKVLDFVEAMAASS